MPIIIENRGANNVIDIADREIDRGSGKIIITGDDNQITIAGSEFHLGLTVELGFGNRLEIGEHLNARNLFIFQQNRSVLRIGSRVSFNGQVRLLMHESGEMSVGDGCLFGDSTDIANSDMHSIIDAETGKRINFARDVEIGERVWVGQRCMLLKGSHIGEGSIIGAGSIVAAAIPAQSLAAGCPARILRSGVTWDFQLL